MIKSFCGGVFVHFSPGKGAKSKSVSARHELCVKPKYLSDFWTSRRGLNNFISPTIRLPQLPMCYDLSLVGFLRRVVAFSNYCAINCERGLTESGDEEQPD